MSQVSKNYLRIVAGIIIIFLDQLLKFIIRKKLSLGQYIPVTSFLNITYIENTGTVFGLFQGANSIFIILSCIIILFLLWLYFFKQKMSLLVLILIVSGAIGNIIDRIFYSRVIDFVDIYVGKHHWPAFNLADMSITFGIAIFFVQNLCSKK